MAGRPSTAVWLGATAAVLAGGWWLWSRRAAAAGPTTGPGSVVFPVDGARWPGRELLAFGYERTAQHTHQGIDIGAPKGTTVRAAVSGTVVKTCSALCAGFSGYGRVVVIKGDPSPAVPQLWWLYAHLDAVLVSAGQRVRAGEPIGRVGDACFRKTDPQARCKGPHLHFEASPRPYPQDSEAWRYNPQQALVAIETGTARRLDTTAQGPLIA